MKTVELPNTFLSGVASAGIIIPPEAAVKLLPEDQWMSNGADQSNMEHRADPVGPLEDVRHHNQMSNGHQKLENGRVDEQQAPWPEKWETILMAPYEYIESTPGKDIRGQFMAAFNAWLMVPEESLKIISKVIAMLHTASLLIDDIEDASLLRRGIPVAHSIFGIAQTINTANYVYFAALRELTKLRNPRALEIYTEELLNLHRGQGLDLYWRESLTCPTEEEYLEMVRNKTGGLFRLGFKLMQAESAVEKARDYIPLVDTIGALFQILDDYKNLSSSTYTLNKGFAEDLTEGKFSFPVIHAIRADPRSQVVLSVLKQKTTNPEIKRYVIDYMESVGSFERTREVLRDLLGQARALVDAMDESHDDSGSQACSTGIRRILERLKIDEKAT